MKKLLILFLGLSFFMACDDEADLEEQGFTLEELPGYVAFNAPGTAVTLDDFTASETSDPVAINVEVPTGTLTDVTVNYSLTGSAVFGVDYTITGATAAGGTLVIPAGADEFQDLSNEDIVVTLLTDAVADGDKTLTIELISAENAEGTLAVGRGGTDFLKTAVLNISNVDVEVSLSTDALSLVENSTDTATFSVSLNQAAPEPITVTMNVTGNLMSGSDFAYTEGDPMSVVIPAGEMSADFGVRSLNDNLAEEDSAIFIISAVQILDGFTAVVTGADSLEFTISDEDKIVALDIESDSVVLTTINDAGFYEFPVTLSTASDQTITLDYAITATGGAAGVDYQDQGTGTVTFEAGQTRTTITIQVLSAAFDNAADVNVSVELDAMSLGTADDEVTVGSSLEFDITVDNDN